MGKKVQGGGKTHQRTMAARVPAKDAPKTKLRPPSRSVVVAESSYNLGDSLSLVRVAVTFITSAFVPTIWERATLILLGAGLLGCLSYKSHWVRHWPMRTRHSVGGALVGLLVIGGGLQLFFQWQPERQTKHSGLTTQQGVLVAGGKTLPSAPPVPPLVQPTPSSPAPSSSVTVVRNQGTID